MTQSHCSWNTPKGIKVSTQQRHLCTHVSQSTLNKLWAQPSVQQING